MELNKKAIFFLIDALVCAIILISAVFLFLPYDRTHGSINHQSIYWSTDILSALDELKIHEINQSWVQNKTTEGAITDVNNTVLTQLAEFWVTNNNDDLNELINQTLLNRIPQHINYGIWINDESIWQRSNSPSAHIVSSWKVVSGIEKTKPYRGFVANARANKLRGNSTMIVAISPEGSGWDAGYVEITKWFNTTGLNMTTAELIVSTHTDESNNDMQVDFNSGQCSFTHDDVDWLFGSEGDVGTLDVGACITSGLNRMDLHLNNNGYNAHTHPGMYLKINYTSDFHKINRSKNITKRYYFDNINSVEQSGDDSGVFAVMPFNVPPDANNVSVNLQIVGNNLRDYTGNNWFGSWSGFRRQRDYDYTLFINSDSPVDIENHPASNVVYNYDNTFISPYLIDGTNVISVYFNNYGDYAWGDGTIELYSEPYSDPEGSSYVEVSYLLDEVAPYGLIEISDVQNFGGSVDDDKTGSFSYPSESIQKGDINFHIVQRYSYLVDVNADTFNPPATNIFESPSARAVPGDIFIDSSVFSITPTVTNYIRARDPGNDIIGTSAIEYSFYLSSFVGFGNVFANQSDASEDALSRLQDALGTYLIADEIASDVSEMDDVPSLWGPAIIEVRVWN